MNYIGYHMNDGANWQARCVCAYIGTRYVEDEKVDLNVYRYENGREQGYIFTARKDGKQRNYAVYEHRNSDTLCVVINDTFTYGAPASSQIYEGMDDKWDTDMEFHMGEIVECGDAIIADIQMWAEELEQTEQQ